MAADLHIHIMTDDITEDDLADLFSHSLGSKWFDMLRPQTGWDAAYDKIKDTPNVWVGEVSWLKAAVFRDSDTFIPNLVQSVHETIREDLPVIDSNLIELLRKAMRAGNETSYDTAKAKEVIDFLKKHHGKRVFTVSW